MEKKLKRSEMRSWELTCTLRAIYESWNKKEGACVTHRKNGMLLFVICTCKIAIVVQNVAP